MTREREGMRVSTEARAPLGIEADLFRAADKLRRKMESSEDKHVVLGLIFLKHISNSLESKRAELLERWRR